MLIMLLSAAAAAAVHGRLLILANCSQQVLQAPSTLAFPSKAHAVVNQGHALHVPSLIHCWADVQEAAEQLQAAMDGYLQHSQREAADILDCSLRDDWEAGPADAAPQAPGRLRINPGRAEHVRIGMFEVCVPLAAGQMSMVWSTLLQAGPLEVSTKGLRQSSPHLSLCYKQRMLAVAVADPDACCMVPDPLPVAQSWRMDRGIL